MLEALITADMTIFSLITVLWIRLKLVQKLRLRRIDEIRKASFTCDDEKVHLLEEALEQLRIDNFHNMTFDLTRWTYKQLFPKPIPK